jgi:phage tail sheath protein FI
MPEYLSPGVYIEELNTGPRPIEGVSTSTAGFVGQTERGPEAPMLMTSWLEFQRWYGGYLPVDQSFLPYSVQGFFDNGGQRLYIARVVAGSGPNLPAGGKAPERASQKFGDLLISATGRGDWGNRIFVALDAASQAKAGTPTAKWVKLSVVYYSRTPVTKGNVAAKAAQDSAEAAAIAATAADKAKADADAAAAAPTDVSKASAAAKSAADAADKSTAAKSAADAAKTQADAAAAAAPTNAAAKSAAAAIATASTSAGLAKTAADKAKADADINAKAPAAATATTAATSAAAAQTTATSAKNAAAAAVVAGPADAGKAASAYQVAAADVVDATAAAIAAPTDAAKANVAKVSADKAKASADQAKTAADTAETNAAAVATVAPADVAAAAASAAALAAQTAAVTAATDAKTAADSAGAHVNAAPPSLATATKANDDAKKAKASADQSVIAANAAQTAAVSAAGPQNLAVSPLRAENHRDAGFRPADHVEAYDNLRLAKGASNSLDIAVNGASHLIHVTVSGTNISPSPQGTGADGKPEPLFTGLFGGSEGMAMPSPDDYKGSLEPIDRSDPTFGIGTGLEALGAIEGISLLAAPDEVIVGMPLTTEVINQCELLRDRFGIVSVQSGQGQSAIPNLTPPTDTTYAAFYYPWIEIYDPLSNGYINVPPTGHVTGLIARVDIDRGVHKAPANEVLRDATNLEFPVPKGNQDVLNPKGVNCTRDFREHQRGIRLYGARTMSSDPEWKYINVRRLFIFVEQSIYRGTQWVVFEPNDDPLWAQVTRAISNFLVRVWKSGALMGRTEQEAFFVKCDRTTMTQDDIDNGRLVCYIGIAPTKPAEFVIFRISQKTADAPA